MTISSLGRHYAHQRRQQTSSKVKVIEPGEHALYILRRVKQQKKRKVPANYTIQCYTVTPHGGNHRAFILVFPVLTSRCFNRQASSVAEGQSEEPCLVQATLPPLTEGELRDSRLTVEG
jgi:hypothetical protein